ncbi:MAG: isochorismatase family protein [Bacteroidota bacterium]|nr:isochorismatase family protein [Candidatus Kapabacteria bacterium]MDW8219927.1 isochorismatase family protein [Bacteroidota bacterium]
MKIRCDNALAVVIDVQERLFPHMYDKDSLADAIEKFIHGVQVLNLPVIVTEQYTKGLGKTLSQLQTALADYYSPLEKMTFSCCGNKEFTDSLDNLGRRQILLVGIEAHICVLQTALDLRERRYHPVILEDCISSRKPNDKRIAIQRMQGMGCTITTLEAVLFELCGTASVPAFKQIYQIVK